MTIFVRKGWFFWQAQNGDEPVGEVDFPTTYRSRTRGGAIAKARKSLEPDRRWERVEAAPGEREGQ